MTTVYSNCKKKLCMDHLFCRKSFHSRGRGPWAWVKLIDKQTGEFVVLNQCHCLLKILPSLCRKATDYVCCYGNARHPENEMFSYSTNLHSVNGTTCNYRWIFFEGLIIIGIHLSSSTFNLLFNFSICRAYKHL